MGPTRAEALLLDPVPFSAAQAEDYGLVSEVVPDGQASVRARELASRYLSKPAVTRRDTRTCFMQPLKLALIQQTGYGLSLEGASAAALLTVTDGDQAMSLSESAAILVYLAERHGGLLTTAGEARARVFEQLFFHASAVSPAFGQAGYFQKLAPEALPLAIERFHGEALRMLALLDGLLAKHEYVAGITTNLIKEDLS